MAHATLAEEILKVSKADTWDQAVPEWKLMTVFITEEPERCLCGHFPIKELCILFNPFTLNRITVGNECVKKFMGLPTDRIFRSLKRITEDISRAVNEDTIQFLFDRQAITDYEYRFYLNTRQKRDLSRKQEEVRIRINQKIIDFMPLHRDPRRPYTWQREHPDGYEVSKLGDDRFSELVCVLPKGTSVNLYNPNRGVYPHVLTREATLMELLEIGIRGFSNTNEGFKQPARNGIRPEQCWQLYRQLWQTWAGLHPDLMDELMKQASGLVITNQFANSPINSARALAELLNDQMAQRFSTRPSGSIEQP